MDSEILDQLEALYDEELTSVQDDLGQSETCIRAIIKSIGVGLLQRVVGSHAAGLDYDSSGLLSWRRVWG